MSDRTPIPDDTFEKLMTASRIGGALMERLSYQTGAKSGTPEGHLFRELSNDALLLDIVLGQAIMDLCPKSESFWGYIRKKVFRAR